MTIPPHKPNFDTNLNGVYSEDEKTNRIGISFCNQHTTAQCYDHLNPSVERNWKLLKLSKVQMFLKKNDGKFTGNL